MPLCSGVKQKVTVTSNGSIKSLAVSPDGLFAYAGMAIDTSALASFARQVGPTCTDGTATVTAGVPTPIALPCADANGVCPSP